MSSNAHVTLPCGCKINECFVLAMCLKHVDELQKEQALERARYIQYVEHMREADQTSEGNS